MQFSNYFMAIGCSGFLALQSLPAESQWIYAPNESSFDKTRYNLITADTTSGSGLLFSCTSDLKPYFGAYMLLSQQVSDEEITKIIVAEPELLFRIDAAEILSMKAYADNSTGLRFLIAKEADLTKLVRALPAAKSNISVAVKIDGRVQYERQFSAIGAADSAKSFLKRCVDGNH